MDSPSGRSKSEGSEPTDPEEAARKNENEGNDDAKPPRIKSCNLLIPKMI